MIMLQYFVKGSAVPFFPRGQEPHLKYICNVDSEASKMPRSMHEHPHLAEAVLVYKGAGIFMIGGRQYTAKEGDFIIYNSRTVHDEFGGNGTNELHTYCLGISNLYLPGQPECQLVPSGYSPIISTGNAYPSFLSLCRLIEQEIQTQEGADTANLLARALITKLARLILTQGERESPEEDSLSARIRRYIDHHYREDLRLADVAQALHANPYYLSHIFKEESGFSPMKYATLRRIGEAQNLLINTDMTITSIAAQIGYNNSNYFQNVFRNAVGISPGEYRRQWTQ